MRASSSPRGPSIASADSIRSGPSLDFIGQCLEPSHVVGRKDLLARLHALAHLEPGRSLRREMRCMLLLEALGVAQPVLVNRPFGEVNQPDIQAHRKTIAGEMAAEGEVGIVAVPAVEGDLVEAYFFGHLAADGEEHAVHALDGSVHPIRGAEKLDVVPSGN